MASEHRGISYSEPYELTNQLIEEYGEELPGADLGRELSVLDILPEPRQMELVSHGEDVSLEVFDLSEAHGHMAIVLFLTSDDHLNKSYLYDSERILTLLFDLLDSGEFRPESTGYPLERAIGKWDHVRNH